MIELVIKINEDVFTRLFDNGIQDNEIAVDDVCEMARALRLGTPLPEHNGRLIDKRGALTNGDVIWALFPNISIETVYGGDIWFRVDNSYFRCSESWWNSPYKGSDSE